MPQTGYTLLIVESPVIARIIQNLAPSYVYVLATGGYAWNPNYNHSQNKLKAIANPEKRAFRKELKEQAQWASQIIIATDSDPSGDFIAWSIAKFISQKPIQRGYLQNLTSSGIKELLDNTQELHTYDLEIGLQNRYLIQEQWYSNRHLPDYYAAGLSAIFGNELQASHFIDEKKNLYKSSDYVQCQLNSIFTLHRNDGGNFWRSFNPISTYDAIEYLFDSNISTSFKEAQNLLQKLFETRLPSTQQTLISYPRTNATGYYRKTWDSFYNQYLQINTHQAFKPPFLRNTIHPNIPHESIHPLSLKAKPDQIKNELHSNIAELYRWIYKRSVNALALPYELKDAYKAQLYPEIYFYPLNSKTSHDKQLITVHPCLTIADLGKRLSDLQIIKPSKFGTELDRWVLREWIKIESNIVKPGKKLYPYLSKAEYYSSIFQKINIHTQHKLLPETVRSFFSSY